MKISDIDTLEKAETVVNNWVNRQRKLMKIYVGSPESDNGRRAILLSYKIEQMISLVAKRLK